METSLSVVDIVGEENVEKLCSSLEFLATHENSKETLK